jgi:hypothetical protein
MKPTNTATWSTSKRKLATATKKANEDQEELDDLLEDMAEDKLDDLDVADTPSLICLSRILLPPPSCPSCLGRSIYSTTGLAF